MRDKNENLETALRVLGSIVDGAEPERADAEALRGLFPDNPAVPLEELARAIVHRCATRESTGADRHHNYGAA